MCSIPKRRRYRDTDVLNDAMKNIDIVIHLAAMWLLHCKDYPRTAFKVNMKGPLMFWTSLKIIFSAGYSSSASVYGMP